MSDASATPGSTPADDVPAAAAGTAAEPTTPTSDADDAGAATAPEPPSPGGDDETLAAVDDAVVALRAELGSIGQLPVAERLERFERANAVLADELASLDEV